MRQDGGPLLLTKCWVLLGAPNNIAGAPINFRKCQICPSIFFFKLAALWVFFYISSFVSFILLRFMPFVVVFASVERVSSLVKVKLLSGGVFFFTEVHILWLFWVSCILVDLFVRCNIRKNIFRKLFTEDLLP